MNSEFAKFLSSALLGFVGGGMSGFLLHPLEADLKSRFDHCDAFVQEILRLPSVTDRSLRDAQKAEFDSKLYLIGDPRRLPLLAKSYNDFHVAYGKFNESLSKGDKNCSHSCLREAGASVREPCTDEFSSMRWLIRRFLG